MKERTAGANSGSHGERHPAKVLFVLPSMKGAGAQRTVLNIVNHLDRARFRPMLALYQVEGEYLGQLREDVEIIDLGASRARWAVVPLARCIRRLKPDLIFSTLLYPNAVTVLASVLSRQGTATVVRETNNWSAAGRRKQSVADRLVGWAYRRADRVVCLSRGVAADCALRCDLSPERLRIIYNPVDISAIAGQAQQDPDGCPFAGGPPGCYEVIAVGRLTRQKGFDLLLRAMARIESINWRLTILGEGEERPALDSLASELGVRDRLLMPGFQDNPYSWMARADLFVLSSRWEGFGHVIAEAMACGTPVLATRCPSGPDEIISDGVDGLLCEPGSVDDLAAGIEHMATHPEESRRYAAAAWDSVRRFDIATIVKQYEELFLELLGAREPDPIVRWRHRLTMKATSDMERYLDAVTELDLFRSRGSSLFSQKGNLLFYLDYLFGDTDFQGMTMLDIGAGAGVFSCYAALRGARSVVALEPEGEGSAPAVASRFQHLVERLGLSNVHLERCTLQEFAPGSQEFDILLMNNSINHLDEAACVELRHSEHARAAYTEIFEKIGDLVRPGGVLIAADASRYNLFAALKVTNPFSPGIEWQKHQSPELWARMLEEAGFRQLSIRWGCLKQLRKPGRRLLGNRWAAYFLQSHFCLTMVKE